MSVKPIKLNTVVFLVLALCIGLCIGLSFGLFRGIGIGRITTVAQPDFSSKAVYPVRNVSITIDPSQREELFAQIRKFASKWKYAILIDPSSLNPENFSIYLWRYDMRAAADYPIGPGRLAISFFIPIPRRQYQKSFLTKK